jgi:hypothetical protein
MEALTPSNGKKCSWCGTLNSADDHACSKCGAVLSPIQPSPGGESSASEIVTPLHAQENGSSTYQGADTPLFDSSQFDKVAGEVIRDLGLAPPFKSGQTRALVVTGFLSFYIVLSLFVVFVDYSRIELLSKAANGVTISRAEVRASDAQTLLVGLALLSVVLFTGVSFLAWIYRAHKNLKAHGALDLEYSLGWAIGWFFVPLLNLYFPYQVVREIWNASAPRASRSGETVGRSRELPPLIVLWWGSSLALFFLDSTAAKMFFGASTIDDLLAANRFSVAGDVIGIVCALLAITVVLKIDARQQRLNSSVSLLDSRQPEIVKHQL